MIKKTNSAEQTHALGQQLAKSLKSGDVVALYGGLGTGKTVFAKGIARGLNISDEVVSPTFTLLKEYAGDLTLHHFDLYRIEDVEELTHIGFYDYLGSDGICVIEWAQNTQDLQANIDVHFSGSGSDERKIEIKGMACPFCAGGMARELEKIAGVEDVDLSFEDGIAYLSTPIEQKPSKEDLIRIVEDAGFNVGEITYQHKPFEKDKRKIKKKN